MRLLSCYLEKFGTFTETSLSFEAGLTQFCRENGFGKTTLAHFILAMFYGMETDNARAKELTDRAHYRPLGGGTFGGSLTFSHKGKIYRIERTFDPKSATRDTLTVYRDGVQTEEFGQDVGRAVMGVDRETFLRTVFVGADDMSLLATDGIRAKLNGFVDATVDGRTYEDTVALLEEAQKNVESTRRAGAEIPRLRSEIQKTESEISNLRTLSDSLDGYYREYAALLARIRETEQAERDANRAEVARGEWQVHDGLVRAMKESLEELEALTARYPHGIPKTEEIHRLRDLSNTLRTHRATLDGTVFGPEKEQTLVSLTARLADAPQREAEVDGIATDLDRIATLEGQIAQLCEAQRTKTAPSVPIFEGKEPSDATVTALREHLATLSDVDRRIRVATEVVIDREEPEKQGKNGTLPTLLTVLCILLAAAGIATLFIAPLVGGVLLLLALGCAVGRVLLRPRRTSTPATPLTSTLIDLREMREKVKTDIYRTVSPYGFYTGDPRADADAFLREWDAYRAYLDEKNALAATLARLRAQKERDLLAIRARLAGYAEGDASLRGALTALRDDRAAFARLQAEKASCETARATLSQKIDACEKERQSILQTYALPADSESDGLIGTLLVDANRWEVAKKTAIEAEKKVTDYRQEHTLTERPPETAVDVEALRATLEADRAELATLNRTIVDMEREVETLADKENTLVLLNEHLNTLRERAQILRATVECLREAEHNLMRRYVAPVSDRLTAYAGAVDALFGEEVALNRELKPTYQAHGATFGEEHLSRGERAVASLCYRLALTDTVFDGDPPFHILDDPFAELDAPHMEKVAVLIRKLSENKQFVYFCCHESRKILP